MSKQSSNAVFWYLEELTSKIVAKTGIPSDRYHVGKILLHCLKESPDYILQIDGATDEKETFQSGLERSIKCATAFRNLGLKFQDVIIIMAPNHIDLVIPMYAALYLGIMVAGVDTNLGVNELKHTFQRCVPNVIFCQSEKVEDVQEALNSLNMSAQIIVFDESENHLTFSKFLNTYGGDVAVQDFKPNDFDAGETSAMLVATSGSTGLPKTAELTYKNLMMGLPLILISRHQFPTPVKLGLVISPVQWLSSTCQFILGPIVKYTRLQTSSPATQEHVYFLINKYKPDMTLASPTFLRTLLKPGDREKCDFSCFRFMLLGGSAVTKGLLQELKELMPNVYAFPGYGLSEASGLIFDSTYSPIGSLGLPMGVLQMKLVDPSTDEEINTANVTGELYLKGPTVFKCYRNNPEQTALSFDKDGWFKSGDMLYRDENHNYYYVDRIKMLLKYKNHQVSPVELERVIIKHPAVLDVTVTGIADEESGDLPVAVVIRRNGLNVTAQEIKDLVKDSLADSKHLRGGVIFMKEFPTTSTSKVDRMKLKKMVQTLPRE